MNSDCYIDNILDKIVKPAFNDSVVQRILFCQPKKPIVPTIWCKMSHVTQINSLVRWKHSFIHSPKTGPQYLLTCLQLKKFLKFFQTTCTEILSQRHSLIWNVIRNRLEKRPSSAAGSSQWRDQATILKMTSTYFVHLCTQLKNYQKLYGSFLIRPFWKRLANLCVTPYILEILTQN